ncbi:MAG: hypothetical protein ACFCBW_04155 [Candidatus Competibacterales bacterium]
MNAYNLTTPQGARALLAKLVCSRPRRQRLALKLAAIDTTAACIKATLAATAHQETSRA